MGPLGTLEALISLALLIVDSIFSMHTAMAYRPRFL